MKKTVSKKSSRIDVIDLFRIIFMAFIMMLHYMFIFSGNPSGVRARSSYIFVEAFFIITGYFTVSHFKKGRAVKIDTISKNALSYTLKKFLPFLPFVIISVLFGFAITFLYTNYSLVSLLIEATKLFEEFLYGSIFVEGAYHCGPLWYLSAMFIIFPLFCILAQSKKYRSARNLLCTLITLLFLFIPNGAVGGFGALLRAFCSLILGLIIFELSEWLKNLKLKPWCRYFFQVLELCSALLIFLIVMQHGNIIKAYPHVRFCTLLSFITLFTVIFSRQSFSSNIRIPFISKAARYVLPVFLLHENIAFLFSHLGLHNIFSATQLKVLYFATTILISVIIYNLVVFIQKRVSLKKLFLK